jgi:hypothetical protein
VVAEELLVEDPVRVFWADVDVDHGAGEEPTDAVLVVAQCFVHEANATMRGALDGEINVLMELFFLCARHDFGRSFSAVM